MASTGKRDGNRERFWRGVLRRREASGVTVRGFCLAEGLSEASYYHWRREVARRDRESRPRSGGKRGLATVGVKRGKRLVTSGPAFQELAIVGGLAAAGHGVEIILPDGCRVRVSGEVRRELLLDVLAALETRRC